MSQKRQINFSATTVFHKNYEALFNSEKRHIINEGSSRSSKTISICQLLIAYALKNKNKHISIVRKTLPALRATAMRDFFEELNKCGLYSQKNHNKTENIYTFETGTVISFFSTDDSQKLRGRKSSIVWANEANELFYEDYVQLNLRTEEKLIFDYNPSESVSWIYELPPDECVHIHSTYKDNPFVAPEIVRQIELYKVTDPELYEVFGLGKRINGRQNIYAGWNFLEERPARFQSFVYGIDFGYNHPTALVKVWHYENELFIEELLYERYLTAADIVTKLNSLNLNKDVPIIAEVARPEINQELVQAGYYIINANKAVKEGINAVKSYIVNVSSTAKNIRKEFENYKWKKIGDRITDDPIKLFDDGLDGLRYGVLYIKNNIPSGNQGPQFFSLDY